MIISDHYGFRQRLGNRLTEVVGQGEDDLEPLLFGVMLTVTGNPHGGLHLPVPPCTGFGMVLECPLLDLLSVKDDHSLGLVLHLERIRRRLRGRFGPELGFADSMLEEMDFCYPKGKIRKPELDRDLHINLGFSIGRTDF